MAFDASNEWARQTFSAGRQQIWGSQCFVGAFVSGQKGRARPQCSGHPPAVLAASRGDDVAWQAWKQLARRFRLLRGARLCEKTWSCYGAPAESAGDGWRNQKARHADTFREVCVLWAGKLY